MKNKKENFESESFGTIMMGRKPIKSLHFWVNWVKSVPNAIKEIEQNGSKEELIRYKKQVKWLLKS